ncbi:MAG TPA: hypothetical protein VF459_15745 [Caulobacteraceae bacterium]
MSFDIRLPIGLLFLAIGAILVVFGLTSGPSIYEAHSLGVNINLFWGGALGIFGLLMLALTIRKAR